MALNTINKRLNGLSLFKATVPKAKYERGVDQDGLPFVREVDHVRTLPSGRMVRYHPRKGWKVVQEYNPHILLNELLVKNGFNSLY